MLKMWLKYQQFKPGLTCRNLLANKETNSTSYRNGSYKKPCKQAERGALPWELHRKCADQRFQPKQTLMKASDRNAKMLQAEQEQKRQKCCSREQENLPVPSEEEKCAVLEKPMRNSYEVVTEAPSILKRFMDKTICELRRFEKCMRLYHDPNKCQRLGPNCTKTKKVYPMSEASIKPSLPGCARPLPKK